MRSPGQELRGGLKPCATVEPAGHRPDSRAAPARSQSLWTRPRPQRKDVAKDSAHQNVTFNAICMFRGVLAWLVILPNVSGLPMLLAGLPNSTRLKALNISTRI